MKKITNLDQGKAKSPQERILDAAVRLFNAQGVHTTGIDQIIAESGVAKRTFYNHFDSKNKVIAAYYRLKDDAWFSRLAHHSSIPTNPVDRVLGLFDGLKEWFQEDDFAGCTFIRGLSDFGQKSSDPELVTCVTEHFSRTKDLLTKLLAAARPGCDQQLVNQMMSLIAGATVVAHASRDPSVADTNKEVARALLAG
jgi:AcrR family transcriptional regulator